VAGAPITSGCTGFGVRKDSRSAGGSKEMLRSEYPHHVWAIDFQFDQTMNGRTRKFLNVFNDLNRVCLAIRVGRRFRAVDVIDTIEELLKLYPPPTHLRMDNGHAHPGKTHL